MVWKPGESGNKAGRPRNSLNRIPKNFITACKENAPSLFPVLLKKALGGNMQAIEVILNYGFGRPRQRVEQQSVNMDWSSWTNEDTELFIKEGKVPELKD